VIQGQPITSARSCSATRSRTDFAKKAGRQVAGSSSLASTFWVPTPSRPTDYPRLLARARKDRWVDGSRPGSKATEASPGDCANEQSHTRRSRWARRAAISYTALVARLPVEGRVAPQVRFYSVFVKAGPAGDRLRPRRSVVVHQGRPSDSANFPGSWSAGGFLLFPRRSAIFPDALYEV